MCNPASSTVAACVSWLARKYEEFSTCLGPLMRSEHILLATLAFFNLVMTGVVYYEAKNPSYHR